MVVAILGISCELPLHVETNDDLQRENPDWRMAEVYGTSGIWSRHIVASDETASDLGFRAAAKLLAREIVPLNEIDYIVYCTQSPDYFLPATACVLQDLLGLGKHVGALDFNLGCSGFVYGLQMAHGLVMSGAARNVLLITADTPTKFVNSRDRTTRTLFGDAGAATLIGSARQSGCFGDFVVGTDGSGAKNLMVPSGGMRMPRSRESGVESTDKAGCTRSADNLYMDGNAVFSFAVITVPRTIKSLLLKAKMTIDDIDWFVYHQANRYMLETLAKQSRIPLEKMLIDVRDHGNVSSSSIPITLQRAVEAGRIQSGQKLVLAGFGVGYSWGACNIVWD